MALAVALWAIAATILLLQQTFVDFSASVLSLARHQVPRLSKGIVNADVRNIGLCSS